MISLEIGPGVGDEFTIGWVVDRLDARNLGLQRWRMLFDVLDQFRLGIGWPRDEHGACIGDGLGHVLQEGVVLRRVATSDAVGLVVNMARRMIGLEDQTIDLGLIEMKDPGFMMVDPDDGVIVI